MTQRLFPMFPVACLFLLGAATPTPRPTGPQIILTPINGAPSVFELVRVEGETVEVRKEGVRLQFSRAQVKSARNAEAEALLEEASRTLAEVESQDLGRFEALVGRLDRQSKALSGVASRFAWLIPAASPTLTSLNQALSDVQSTLDAVQTLQGEGDRLEKMARGSIPLDATWEESFNVALEQANLIPYPVIRKDIVDRLVGLRRDIRLDLAKGAQASADRVAKLNDELQAALVKGELTEARATLLIKEMRRYAIKVPEADRRAELESLIARTETFVASSLERLARTRAEKAARATIQELQENVGKAASQRDLAGFSARLEDAREAAAALSAPTSEELVALLEEVSQHFSALPAEPPQPATAAVTGAVQEPAPASAEPQSAGKPGDLVSQVLAYVPESLRPHLSNLWFWNGVLAVLLVTPKRVLVPARRKKAAAVRSESPELARVSRRASTATEDDELFGPAVSPVAASAPLAAVVAASRPEPVAPKKPEEDVFGFGPGTSVTAEAMHAPAQPDSPPAAPVTVSPKVPKEEDPFAVVDEVFATAPPTVQEPKVEPEPVAPTPPSSAAKEADPFGFGDTPVESILASAHKPEPPKPVEKELEAKKTSAEEDPFGFGPEPLEDFAPVAAPPAPAPTPSQVQTAIKPPEEDPFGFGSEPVTEIPEPPPPARPPEPAAPPPPVAETPPPPVAESAPPAPEPDLSLVAAGEEDEDLLLLDPFGYETDPETLLPHELEAAPSPGPAHAPGGGSDDLGFDVEDPFGLIQGSVFEEEPRPSPAPPPPDVLDEEDPFGLGKDNG
ncbi:MAG: hypothetical protein GHCLOJNM_03967 [bacterium]|nr:hypothetical protein [bacterium]